MERDTPCTSILLVMERDTTCMFILLVMERVHRDTQCTFILLVVVHGKGYSLHTVSGGKG